MGEKLWGGEAAWATDRRLLFWDRHRAFRPCVLFLENVPAETL